MGDETEGKLREIEQIIDKQHLSHPFFPHNLLSHAVYNLLDIYEGMIHCTVIASAVVNSMAIAVNHSRASEDALNMAIHWSYLFCQDDGSVPVSHELSEEQQNEAYDLLTNYASPYSELVDSYRAYSRERWDAEVSDNEIKFVPIESQKKAFYAETGKHYAENNDATIAEEFYRVYQEDGGDSVSKFSTSIKYEDGILRYDEALIFPLLYKIGEIHWKETSVFPQTWTFDGFTMDEFKTCWIEIYSIAFARFIACLLLEQSSNVKISGCYVLGISKKDLIKRLSEQVSGEAATNIVGLLSFNPKLKNSDIMYQPLVELHDKILISPSLILTSKGERNLIALVQKTKDSHYSSEVNGLESKMRHELVECLNDSQAKDYITCNGIHIGSDLPDVDFGIYDKTTNNCLICELKWFLDADSSSEVFAREDEIDHGCQQVEKVMGYAMRDRNKFVNELFHIQPQEEPDIYCCVVSKGNIRSNNKYVPVISQNKIEELIQKYSLDTVFHNIRNEEFYDPLPAGTHYKKKEVNYAGYKFLIPALRIPV